jgi:toxin YoeB
MRKVAFLPRGFSEFNHWIAEDKKIYAKIVSLLKDIDREPFSGLRKPEPLKSMSYQDFGRGELLKNIVWFIK